ncbi:MAG: clan AA aspartic protease [Candidatus Eremiobacteraeota bacterium]|nr:clan AA aspartic protease [Candidatus Eremiobacteraeota bacterium]
MIAAIVLAAVAPSLSGSNSTTVPFMLFDNRMLVQTRIDGDGPFTMVVDTGSYEVDVTPAVARRLSLAMKPAGSATGAGSGSTQFFTTQIPTFALGSLRLANIAAGVIDLSAIQRAIGFPRLDGIIGYGVLGKYRVGVDMDAQRLTLSAKPLPVPKAATSEPFTLGGGAIHIAAAVDGIHGRFFVDTGDRSSLTLFRHFAEANNFYRDAPVRNVVTGVGVGGPIYSDVRRTTVSLFGATIPGVVTRLPRDRAGAFATGSDAASIGTGLLKRFNIVYDYPARTIYAWPSHFFAEKDRYAPLAFTNGRLHVVEDADDPTVKASPSPSPSG